MTAVFSRLLPSDLVWQVKTDEKVIYLTFDDGPVPDVTSQILDILDKYGALATFFCVGDNVKKYPELYRMIRQKGHQTGNHSQHHLKGIGTGFNQYLEDIRKANIYIDSRLFRPPYGMMTWRQAKALSAEFTVVMWTVLTRDFDTRISPEKCLRIALEGIKPGAIIVFHDSLKASKKVLYALPRLLEYLNREGYRAEKLCLQ